MPKVRGRSKSELLSVPTGKSAPVVTQSQLRYVLTLYEEIEMIREEIKELELEIAVSIRLGGRIESGPHTAELSQRGKLRLHPFRGGIIR